MTTVAVLVLLAGCLLGSSQAQDVTLAALASQRVLWLGDSITYAGQYVADVETFALLQSPSMAMESVNAGLPSETVSGLSEPGHAGGKFPRPDLKDRLDRVLKRVKPGIVFICYGMNDGIYQPFDDARFQAFKDGMNWVHQKIEATGAKIVHVTPPVFDGIVGKNKFYNGVLDRYSQWLLDQRHTAGWTVIDLHGPMTDYLNERRKIDPAFHFSTDGVHPDDLGHWIMARQILAGLGVTNVASWPDPSTLAATRPHGPEILKLVRQREEMVRNTTLTLTGHKRPGLPSGLPQATADAKSAKIEQQIRSLLP